MRTSRRRLLAAVQLVGLAALLGTWVLARFDALTNAAGRALLQDPERHIPGGDVVVAPADGVVVYVEAVVEGRVPDVVKRGVHLPLVDHARHPDAPPLRDGVLVGIYMPTRGVHINRAPEGAVVESVHIYNGPHVDMNAFEAHAVLVASVPGLVTLERILGSSPFALEERGAHVRHSARETMVLRERDGRHLYVVRIADYYVGKILTWVHEGDVVARGERIGMITWGSQTDVAFESRPGMRLRVAVGDTVRGGETILASW